MWSASSATKCGRSGRYSVARLIAEHGADGKMTDWHPEGDCPKRRSLDMSDQCGARCPDCRRCLGLNFRVTLARTCTEESSQMTDQFQIKWTNGDSKDYVDILNTQLFAQE